MRSPKLEEGIAIVGKGPSFFAMYILFALSTFAISGCVSLIPRVPIPEFTQSPPIKISSFDELPSIVFEKGIVALTRGTEIGSGGMVLNRFGGDTLNLKKGDTSHFTFFMA